ncbi:MAG: DUF523 domain-containing protein [Oscillospiraceae bacterium]|nr:DUF523 domain-containing protein [Oscillospiraceae bacterium]
MKKIVVSACLLGENCKYNGGNNRNQRIIDFLRDKEVIAVCPEVWGGLPVPRPCAELCGVRVLNVNGEDVTAQYRAGVRRVLEALAGQEIDFAVLQSRSPACGVKQVYDGSFSGRKIPGMGLLAQALKERGCQVVDAGDADWFFCTKDEGNICQ